ncbi:MAG TPA: LamG domain-containing protein [Gammaproteobacteria bacterium]|nr:LamG domain-containing protein [Gammaproteobacteria bacterium]
MKKTRANTMMKLLKPVALVLAAAGLLAGCGGGADVTQNPQQINNQAPSGYSGPAPATADVQSFKLNLWDSLQIPNRCGDCHNETVGQSPQFARTDDINLAYSAASTVVNLTSPVDSRLVVKVSGGHNCWLQSDSACASLMETYISNWASTSGSNTGRVIQLTPPPSKDPGSSKTFPADSSLFESTVHPVLMARCAGCHTDTSNTPQSPYFAKTDPSVAYPAAKQKIDLDTPANSRLVIRLRDEFHNCWSGNCAADAATMQAAIQAFSDGIALTVLDPALLNSKALTLADGVVASGGNRYEDNVIAMYEFKSGSGTTAYDTSGIEPSVDMTLFGGVTWVAGYGINIQSGQRAQGSALASKKLSDRIKLTGEYSVEAWVVPANVTQDGPARIISYSANITNRNFTLGQTLYNYEFMHRSSTTDINGDPSMATADADEDLQAALQHVVITFDPINGRQIYVNGVHTGDTDSVSGGVLSAWNDSYALVFGNEAGGNGGALQWAGQLRLVAISDRAMTAAQVKQNFDVGVGEKFLLLFEVSAWTGIPRNYVMFEVSQFDNFSYLFNKPVLISLDANATATSVPMQGMSIGINGKEAAVGQAYRNMNTTIDGNSDLLGGTRLSTLGTVIASEKGSTADEFFLTFDQIGTSTNVRTEPALLAPTAPADGAPVPVIGLRTFDEINATMSVLTGVSTPSVGSTYQVILQQLPATADIMGFLSAHQVAVSQLSIDYCDQLVSNTTARAPYFAPFTAFTATPTAAFDTAGRDALLDNLIDKMMGISLTSQPLTSDVKTELNALITRLMPCPIDTTTGQPNCAGRTETIVKASCSALLGSAVTLMQ